MILLSDSHPKPDISERRRVIKIRPFEIDTPNPVKQDSLPSNEEVEKANEELELMNNELEAIQKQKTNLIEQTKSEIKILQEQWQQEKAEITRKAEEDGYNTGFEKGKKESLKKFENLLSQANSIISLANEDYKQSIERAEMDILSLSVHIAEKILHTKLQKDPESFMSLVSKAINEVKEQTTISIYLHPSNYKTVIELKPELVQVLGEQVDLLIFIDYELKPGACIIEHPLGQIDASVDTQLATIKNILKELRMENNAKSRKDVNRN